jgi:hypothetical protein
MIGYRFLLPAEEEMTEASVFYEAATSGLGAGFLDEVGRVINILREQPELGQSGDRVEVPPSSFQDRFVLGKWVGPRLLKLSAAFREFWLAVV